MNITDEVAVQMGYLSRARDSLGGLLIVVGSDLVAARENGWHRVAIALATAQGSLDGAINGLDGAIDELPIAAAYHRERE